MVRKRTALMMAILLVLSLLTAASVTAQDAQPVNINTATVDELVQLDRVGAKVAERIVAYRDANGPFEKPEDLMQVQGVGEKVFERNKDRIVVSENR